MFILKKFQRKETDKNRRNLRLEIAAHEKRSETSNLRTALAAKPNMLMFEEDLEISLETTILAVDFTNF
jgi:hypothetical protein